LNEQDKEYLRDLFAGFALCGILSCDYSVDEEPAKLAYKYADEMMEAREGKKDEGGIVGIKPRRKAERKKEYQAPNT
jgi:hypothetical protein